MYNRVRGPFFDAVVHVRQDLSKFLREEASWADMDEEDYTVEKLYVKIGEEENDDR